MSMFSGILKLLVASAEITAGALVATVGGNPALGAMLIASGAGFAISGIGSIMSKDPIKGFATVTRNSIAPWKAIYGRVRARGSFRILETERYR